MHENMSGDLIGVLSDVQDYIEFLSCRNIMHEQRSTWGSFIDHLQHLYQFVLVLFSSV